jgi:hypothetical protein
MDNARDNSRIVTVETEQSKQTPTGFGAFYVRDHRLAFYIPGNNDVAIPGKKAVDAYAYFMRKIMREAICSLDAYLRKRMDDRDMYGTEKFWEDAFKIVTESYCYFLRAILTPSDYNFYVLCYNRGRLDQYLAAAQSEEG